MKRPTCVLVGLHQNGLGVARALGRMGVRVIAIEESATKAHAATRYASTIVCPDLRGEGLIDTLDAVGRTLERPVLILTLDRSVLLVSRHRKRLEATFSHSLPEDAVIQALIDKGETARFAAANGFKIPLTHEVPTEDDLERCLPEIAFPCILKPQVKTVTFVERSPKKAFFIRSKDELRDVWNRVIQWEPGVVIQEWVPGPDTQLVFGLYYFDRDGQPRGSFTGRKIRQYIPHCGTACAAEPWHDETLRQAGVRFFQSAGYRGFGAIEFKIAPNGDYYLIEPTVGRTEHIFALAAANGVNLPYIGYCDMAGLAVPEQAQAGRPVVYVDWKRDARAAKALVEEGELTWPAWVRSVARRQQLALFAWDDPAPITRHLASRMRAAQGRVTGRVRRAIRHRYDRWLEPWQRDLPKADLGAALVPGSEPGDRGAHIDAALDWLCAAQDAGGGGVARAYSVSPHSGYRVGWQAAYPETTGYIIPTLLDCSRRPGREDLASRALRMADWELTLQHSSGGFPGSTVDRRAAPVVFNTGMVLLGLASAHKASARDEYARGIERASDFLVSAQSRDGAWRRFANGNSELHVHAYDCLVNWGLLESAMQLGQPQWMDAAVRNLRFTLTLQQPNGWFAQNALYPSRNERPLTHTIGYTVAGLIESGVLLGDSRFVEAARLTADAVLDRLGADGFLAGELHADWSPAADWSCLTGTAQMAIVWYRLFELRGDERYVEAARRALGYVMRRHETEAGPPGMRGGVAGSYPMAARYGRFQYLNWAAKFFLDALLLDERVSAMAAPGDGSAVARMVSTR